MGRVVILEGPDGGGKTTLAKYLTDRGFRYFHEGPPPAGIDLIAHYLKILYSSLESSDNIVHDRLWLGERVYGPVSRGIDRVGPEGHDLFQRLHNSKLIHQYICMPGYEVTSQNYIEKLQDPDDFLKCRVKFSKVYNHYQQLIDDGEDQYDYTIDKPDKVYLRMTSRDGKDCLPRGTVGSTLARYLFVGDKPNHEYIDVPFFALNGSSGYLNKAIKLAGLSEEDVAFSNAFCPLANRHQLKDVTDRLVHLKKIILLGNVAKNWFQALPSTVAQAYLPHPSFLRRFRGHNPQVLADMIKEQIHG